MSHSDPRRAVCQRVAFCSVMSRWMCVVSVLLLGGCGSDSRKAGVSAPASSSPTSMESPATPEERLFESLRSAAFQFSASVTGIESSLDEARGLAASSGVSEETKEALADVIDYLDSAGSIVSELTDIVPSRSDLAVQFKNYEKKRESHALTAEDALADLQECRGLLSSIVESTPVGRASGVEHLLSVIEVNIQDVEGALRTLTEDLD